MYQEENIPEYYSSDISTTQLNLLDSSIYRQGAVDGALKLSNLKVLAGSLSDEECNNLDIELDIEYPCYETSTVLEDYEIEASSWISNEDHKEKLNYNYSVDITVPENFGPKSINKLKFDLDAYDRELCNISTFFDYSSDTSIRIYAKELPTEKVIIEKLYCVK
jgi:hypothetical protein